ncbi:MAG: hypothetical protein PHH77_00755 [Victivallaceae bacterium]|nr:hypothetical protein [Victivallaceae bacterium]
MICKNKKRLIRHQYTIIELLVVLVLAGILMGITVGGIKGVLGRQGATGAVRTLANKISLARSLAVSRNRYVALLLPDDDQLNSDLGGSPIANNTANFDDSYLFTQNRLCYVTKNSTTGNYEFDYWVKDYEWQQLPAKTVAFIRSESTAPEDSFPAKVIDVDDSSEKTSSAIIFKPSGALIDAKDVIVRVYRAAYLPANSKTKFYWQGKENKNQGWKIGIKGFTGRAKYCQGGESVEAD